jgi:hypothetical protein
VSVTEPVSTASLADLRFRADRLRRRRASNLRVAAKAREKGNAETADFEEAEAARRNRRIAEIEAELARRGARQ